MLEQRKLRDWDVSDDGAQLTAKADGSSPGMAYELTLHLRSVPPTCTCSCPVGHSSPDRLCKHAIALMLWRCEQLATGVAPSTLRGARHGVAAAICAQKARMARRGST